MLGCRGVIVFRVNEKSGIIYWFLVGYSYRFDGFFFDGRKFVGSCGLF